MKLFLLIFLLPLTSTPIGYRQLQWSDFKGKPPTNTEASACTCTNIAIGYDTAYAIFLPERSWTKTSDPEVLRHERLHFAITRDYATLICAWVKVKNQMHKGYPDFSAELNAWKRKQAQYDAETDHGRDSTAQRRWEE